MVMRLEKAYERLRFRLTQSDEKVSQRIAKTKNSERWGINFGRRSFLLA
jgi:hypothetical protein